MKTPPSRSRKSKTKSGELPQILQNNRGTAYMDFRGRRFYLGKFGSIEAEQERLRIIAECDASGSVVPVTVRRQPVPPSPMSGGSSCRVSSFWPVCV